MVDVYGPLDGASALAANGLVRYIGGVASPLFPVQSRGSHGVLHRGSGIEIDVDRNL